MKKTIIEVSDDCRECPCIREKSARRVGSKCTRKCGMKMLFTNNSRKLAGRPLHRKKNKKRRWYTRNKADETIDAFLDYCYGR